MTVAQQLESLAANLQAYHGHLKAIREAMDALNKASDLILADIEVDQARVAVLADVHNQLPVRHSTPSANEILATTSEASTGERESEIQTEDLGKGAILEADTPAVDVPASAPAIEAPQTVDNSVSNNEIPHEIAPEALTALASLASASAEAALAEAETPAIADAVSGGTTTIDTVTANLPTSTGTVVELAQRRIARNDRGRAPAYRRAATLAASLVITAGTITGVNQLMQTEIGQRIIELGACDGDMLSAQRDCALLAWLLL